MSTLTKGAKKTATAARLYLCSSHQVSPAGRLWLVWWLLLLLSPCSLFERARTKSRVDDHVAIAKKARESIHISDM